MKFEDAALLSVLLVAFYVFPALCLTAQMVKERFEHAVRRDPQSWWVKDDVTCFTVGLALSVSYFIFYLVFAIPLLLYGFCHPFLCGPPGRGPPAWTQHGCWRWTYPGGVRSGTGGTNGEGGDVPAPVHYDSQVGEGIGGWSWVLRKRDPDLENRPSTAATSSRPRSRQDHGTALGYAGILKMSLATGSLATIPESSETTSSEDRTPSY